MVRNMGLARELGYLKIPDRLVVDLNPDFSRSCGGVGV
jgi:hypothetical protein